MAAKKKNFGVEDLWKIDRIGALSVAPDGAQAVCSVTRFSMQENKGRSTLWLLSTLGGMPRPLTQCGEKDGQPCFSPHGFWIGFIGKREPEGRKDDTPQIYVIAPDGDETHRIAKGATG